MKDFDPAFSFGHEVAATYDNEARGDETECVEFLAALAGNGPILELAIGTGRIALPLAATGVRVDGIDISQAMVDQLRTKTGGDDLAITIGDFAAVDVPDKYRLIFVVFNTMFNLLTQDDQVRCFENVATHLTDDGVFVIEAFVPSYLYRLRNDQYVDAEAIGLDEVRLDIGRHDPVAQTLDESHVCFSREGVKLFPIVCRYAWPSELDLMARIAGLRMHQRWGGWRGEPFTSSSERHVSVYGC
ncbi:MAG TPA: class I SAM-dependent methyltransferase [Ilumatobacteraceae bacterium]|nr:class I SAM-dependent methyltransferase [Ilumatobacteraceae bacterium]